jgi:hypothetical protein
MSAHFDLPNDTTALDPTTKRAMTICNLFVNHQLSIVNIKQLLDEDLERIVRVLIENGILQDRRQTSGRAAGVERRKVATVKETRWSRRAWFIVLPPTVRNQKGYIPAENDARKQETFVLRFRHIHESGTDALIIQQANGWQIQINFREPNHSPATITGYLVPSVERAKEIADQEVSRYGHVCNGGCQDWVELPWIHPASVRGVNPLETEVYRDSESWLNRWNRWSEFSAGSSVTIGSLPDMIFINPVEQLGNVVGAASLPSC